ncbi:hypothetical protein PDK93_25380 [Bacillus cereus]|nr:hypothetical protein [Bacillus cereus]
MKLEIQEITVITYGICKGFEEVYLSSEGDVFGELMILLNTEKEILYYFSDDGTMEEQERMKNAAEKIIENGSYRLQSLFMKKKRMECLQEFHYVPKREELRQMSVYFKRSEREDGQYEYSFYQDSKKEWSVTYCFPEYRIIEENCILSNDDIIEELEQKGFDMYDIDNEDNILPF